MYLFKRTSIIESVSLPLVMAACLVSPAWATNLVLNGTFATAHFTDWTVVTQDNSWVVAPGIEGTNPLPCLEYFAASSCVGALCITGTAAQQSSLPQDLATTSGQTYNLTFWFYTGGHGAPNELDVLWDGASVLDLGPGGTLGPISAYTEYTVSDLIATSSSSALTFLGRQDQGFAGLDAISVVTTGPVSTRFNDKFVPEQDHLARFLGRVVAICSTVGLNLQLFKGGVIS